MADLVERIWQGGMIGAGAWSAVQLTAWSKVPNADIVALCDRHPDRRRPIAERFNIDREFDDIETMLDSADLDFVDICTRPYSHRSLVELAAKRRLPVLCQKPFCTSLQEAHEVTEFCRNAAVPIMINENFRWQAWYRQVKEILDSDALGKVFAAQLNQRSRFTLPAFDSRQAYLAEMPCLIVYEMGVHFLDTFRFLFGEPRAVYARLHRISAYVRGEDVMLLTLDYGDMTAQINCSWASFPAPSGDTTMRTGNRVPRIEIDGTNGTLCLAADGVMQVLTEGGQIQWLFPPDARPTAHAAAQQHFIDCLENGDEFETSAADTLKTMALVYACYLSAEEGRVVAVSELYS